MIRIIPSGGMTLRPFKINDAATILSWCRNKRAFRLWSADRYKDFPARPEEMMEQYRGENMYPLTAVVGEAIVGHILLRWPSKDKSVIRLGFVIVDDSKRGKGYGKQMLRHAIDYARRELGARKITLGVFCDNLPALECYKSVGFLITGANTFSIDGEEWEAFEMEFTMETEEANIGSTPALLIGEKSEKVFLFVHGLRGRKEEALAFAEVAVPNGYQVLGIDLPVERKPWEVLPLLEEVRDFLYENWKHVSIRANSIGSWFSLLAFQREKVGQALFVSPILDMKKFIEGMPTREDDYYEWVINNLIACWDAPTYILRPEVDMVVSEETGRNFISQHHCHITIMPGGEHWFHTPEQYAFLKAWEERVLSYNRASACD